MAVLLSAVLLLAVQVSIATGFVVRTMHRDALQQQRDPPDISAAPACRCGR